MTYPYSRQIGSDLHRDLGKDQWLALAVDLLRSSLGEDTPIEMLRTEIVTRMDALHGAGIVPRTLPQSRYPRHEIRAAVAGRPGQGTRTDLQQKEDQR